MTSARRVARSLALSTIACLASACQRAPEELIVVATSAHPALSSAPAAGAHAPLRGPQLTAFTSEKPSGLCTALDSKLCSFDMIANATAADVTSVKRRALVRLSGWAADEQSIPPILVLELTAEKSYYAPATHRVKRTDVAADLRAPALLTSGFDVVASFEPVESGEYAVHFVQVTASGYVLRCTTGRRLRVE